MQLDNLLRLEKFCIWNERVFFRILHLDCIKSKRIIFALKSQRRKFFFHTSVLIYELTNLHYLGQFEFAEMLIANGANVNVADENRNLPLHLAVGEEQGNVKILELLSKGDDINTFKKDGKTLLQLCIERGLCISSLFVREISLLLCCLLYFLIFSFIQTMFFFSFCNLFANIALDFRRRYEYFQVVAQQRCQY